MKLKEVRVGPYRNIINSNLVPVDESITCLVGKNESGKTAFLEALYSLKPAYPSMVRVDITRDYPRWRKVQDQRQRSLKDVAPVRATFSFEETELLHLAEFFAVPLPVETELRIQRTYSGDLSLDLLVSEPELVSKLLASELAEDTPKDHLSKAENLETLMSLAEEQLERKDGRTTLARSLNSFLSVAQKAHKLFYGDLSREEIEKLREMLPTFFYFSEYSSLPGRIDLEEFLNKSSSNLTGSEQTALALLNLVGVKGKEFMAGDFEMRIAELEAAANEITRQIFNYWTQNTDLIVNLAGDSHTVQMARGQSVVHRFLDIRLNDLRHQMTTNFKTRSTGFQWFFSFIVAFSEFENNDNVIILLDEPGLGLHARAQADLLRFVEERLSESTQVIYTSHSPFMVNPKHLHRVRLVEDLTTRENPDIGAKVSTDVLSVEKDTLFPLQAALGYDIAQNLFVGGYNLVVEGISDYVYLSLLREYLEDKNRVTLDPRVTITPVGGADKIPTFVALLGAHVDVTVLIDEDVSNNQRLQDMIQRGLLDSSRLLSVGQVTQMRDANVEDLFTIEEYLELYNTTFSKSLEESDLMGTDSIIDRIEREINSDFGHLRPATTLLRNKDAYLRGLSEGTLNRFEELFNLINQTLPEQAPL
jgi:predicted ATP-dependent endonuclease of OLD family